MGISGLIPFLEKASSKVHLRDIRGSTVAVDTYCWLHKGAFGCAEKLVRGEETDQYIHYCIRYVELLLNYDIKPILVFDGGHLPAKELTERRRRENRQQSRKLAAEFLRIGDKEAARSHMRRCVDVTHEMALRLIRECRLRNVDCIVAPYEADAQLAWFNKMDVAQYVITEDSDLTLFGAKRIIFKLDLTGAGLLVDADKLHLAMGCSKDQYNFDKFRRMCILSGCDYLDSLPGIGLAKACKFILRIEQDDMWKALKKIPTYLNMKNLQVDDEYIEQFHKAEATFKYMYIYNPLIRRRERLCELIDYDTDMRYCSNAGTSNDNQEQALHLALGNLNPFNLKQLDNWHPDRHFGLVQPSNNKIKRAKHKSIWQINYQSGTSITALTAANEGDKCALYFKKVDFISKTIDDEVTANVHAENAKPEEAEIFSLYRLEANESLIQSDIKRRRGSSESNDDGSDNGNLSKPGKAFLDKYISNTHNPFIKLQKPEEQYVNRAAAICENASLLKVLSPKKAYIETTLTNNIKRQGPKSPLDQLQEGITVKSRFFTRNIEEVKGTKFNACRNLSAEIDAIEKQSRQHEEARAMLYDSPSPKKRLVSKEVPTSIINNYTKTTVGNKHHNTSKSKEYSGKFTSEVILDAPDAEESNRKYSLDSAITLSDDDDVDNGKAKQMIMPTQTASVGVLRPQVKQRLGLSKAKTKSILKTQKGGGKSGRSTSDVLQNQTCLTMFGFKKRPTLK